MGFVQLIVVEYCKDSFSLNIHAVINHECVKIALFLNDVTAYIVPY